MKAVRKLLTIGIIGFLIIYIIAAWSLSDRIIMPSNSNFEKSKQRLAENDLSYDKLMASLPTPQSFTLIGEDSAIIKGWYFKSSEEANCGVVMAHGWTGTRIDMLKYTPIFSECGCDMILYDHRAHGESGGEFATGGIKEKYDLIAVTDWLKQKAGLKTGQIGWLGVSWGGSTVLQAGSLEPEIGFIIADSPFQDWNSAIFERAIKDYGSKVKFISPVVLTIVNFRTGIHYKDASALQAASEINAPVLLIHSKADSATASTQSVNIASRLEADSMAFYHTDWGAGHARDIIENKERVILMVNDFLYKYKRDFGSCVLE